MDKLPDTITRVEVIDNTGRAYVKYNIADVELSLQDNARTLKIFLKIHSQKDQK